MGKTVFADLKNIVYYVDVWEENHDNYTLKDEDVGFIRTFRNNAQQDKQVHCIC